MPITLRQLSYFLALVDERSFGRAAQKMHVTQPAMSMQIRELEQSLGGALVERLPREVVPTRAGRALEVRARRILTEVSELEAMARQRSLSGRLHLGMIPTVAPYLLPQVLPLLRSDPLRNAFALREAQTDALTEALLRGQLDAIVIATPATGPELVAEPLFQDRFLLAGHRDALARLGMQHEALRPARLDPDQLLLLDEGHCLADQALEVCAIDRRHRRIDLGASSLSTLCGLVGQGYGLTFLPEIAVAAESAATPGMGLARFADPEPARQIMLVRRTGTEAQEWFAALAEVLRAAGRSLVDGVAGRYRPVE